MFNRAPKLNIEKTAAPVTEVGVGAVEKKENVMTPEENAKMEKLINETTVLTAEVSQITPEDLLKMKEDKKAKVLLNLKKLFMVGIALGFVTLGVEYQALENASRHIGDVSDPKVLAAVMGTIVGVGSIFGAGFSHMMYKDKKEEIASMESQG